MIPYRFILGARDPEMKMIEILLESAGVLWVRATYHCASVRSETAYKADVPYRATHRVECYFPGAASVPSFDHHWPGDYGWGKPPEYYFSSSSLGQVRGWLDENCPRGWSSPVSEMELHIIAAADHCLMAAYRGECLGVTPEALGAWRVTSRANHQLRPVADVLSDIYSAEESILSAQDMIGMPGVADMRWRGFVPELPEAAFRIGHAFVAQLKDPSGRSKVVLQAASGQQIQAFEAWCSSEGLVDFYAGDASRGFAGAYHLSTERFLP